MSEIERLEFEFEWLNAEIEKFEDEVYEVDLRLAKLKKSSAWPVPRL